MGDTTRFLSAINSPELSDKALAQPDERLTPEQLERKRRKLRYEQELLLRVYPESIRRHLLQGTSARSTADREAETTAIVDAGLYVLKAIEEKKVTPKGGDEVRKLIQWKTRRLEIDAARSRSRSDADISLDAPVAGSEDQAGMQLEDAGSDDPALVAEVAELSRAFVTRLTARQRTVLQMLIQGSSVAEIANALNVTPRAVYGEHDRLRFLWRQFTKDRTSDDFACLLDPLLDTLKEAKS
jgi:ATP/maltotriose-dependent transcriptional regulator MalT